jgi:asparagine synthetase B (glutamine-hydrolysing)
MEWDNKVAAMHGLETASPFLDRDLLAFLLGIPGEMQTWKGVPKALLREAMRGVLPEAILRRTWKADFSHLVNEGMAQDFPQVVRCLESDSLAVRLGYLDGRLLGNELNLLKGRMRGSDCEAAWSLSDLLGLEVWLQVFFGETGGGLPDREVPEGSPPAGYQGDAP